jgi:hypothetical protein
VSAAAVIAAATLSGSLVHATMPLTVVESVQGLMAEKGLVVDTSNACGASTAVPVAYMPNELLLRWTVGDATLRASLNSWLRAYYGTTGVPPTYDFVLSIERIRFPRPTPTTPITDVVAVVLRPRPNTTDAHDIVGLSRFISEIKGRKTRPNYGLSPSSPYKFYMPNGLPVPSTTPIPNRPLLPGVPGEVGTGVAIEIYDTGYADQAGVVPDLTMLTPSEQEIIDPNGDTIADLPYAGHGVAIGSVIETLAPGAQISVARIPEPNGIATDRSAARRMATAMRSRATNKPAWPDIIVNAFGTPACAQLEPIGTAAVVEAVERWNPVLPDDTLFMASAGNYGVEEEFYPAALPGVIAVGALDGTIDADGSPWTIPAKAGPIADFSNRGSWVDVWVPGRLLPVVHVSNVSFVTPGVEVMQGQADVDGTSFALPYAAALVAEEIGRTGANPRDALNTLLATSVPPLAECNTGGHETSPGRAISLPSLSTDARTPANGTAVPC